MGKPLHEKIEAFHKHLRDVERSCVANFSNEQITRGRVEALEAKVTALVAHLGLAKPSDDAKTND